MKNTETRKHRGLLLVVFLLVAGVQLLQAQGSTVTCRSEEGDDRQHCPADTSAGVALQKSLGPAECLLGKNWGYDADGVWVADGCSGEFVLGQPPSAPVAAPPRDTEPTTEWGALEPGNGFLVGETEFGDLYISGYGLVRYLNQLPAGQTFVDHLGRRHEVDTRNDFYAHRIMVFFKGWLGLRKLQYQLILWTVNTTDQNAIFVSLGYQFSKKFGLYGGLNALPGTRTLQGSHPYWLAHDRVMADEFFRPYFTNGVWATGEPIPGLWYNAMVGNNLSALGITAKQLTRSLAYSGSTWWMPTTKEFGPRGGFGDWEYHERVATRFGVSATRSYEDRFGNALNGAPDNKVIRLADSLSVFDPGALAPGVNVQQVFYQMQAADAGMKYKGIFLQTELYRRKLSRFRADGPLPVTSLVDKGFYVQAAFFPVKKKIELYTATSQIFGDKSAGFKNSSEYLGGVNFYLANSRNIRINVQGIAVNHSPVSSTFGYYVGGEKGATVTAALSIFF